MSTGLPSDDSSPSPPLGLSYMAVRNYSRGYRCCLRIGRPDCGCGLMALAQMTALHRGVRARQTDFGPHPWPLAEQCEIDRVADGSDEQTDYSLL